MWCWGWVVSKGRGKCSARRVTVWLAFWRRRAVVRPVTPALGGIGVLVMMRVVSDYAVGKG